MKSLFTANYRYNDAGQELDLETRMVVEPLFIEFMNRGYSPREIGHIIVQTAQMAECEQILTMKTKEIEKNDSKST